MTACKYDAVDLLALQIYAYPAKEQCHRGMRHFSHQERRFDSNCDALDTLLQSELTQQ